jgi:protocatechuate 3,4-dioxygenase beta subunit
MSTIGNVLRDADPIRTEPAVSCEQREAVRRAVVEAALRPIPDTERARFRFARPVALLSVVVFILVLGWRLRTPVQPHTAVQAELRLAQNTPPALGAISHSGQSDPDGKNNFVQIQGTVYDEQGQPAQDIEVRIHRLDANGDFRTKTGKAGRYSYTETPPGDYVMGILRNDDIVLIRALTLRAGRNVVSNFDLKIASVTLKAVAFDRLTKEEAARILSTIGGGGFGGGGGGFGGGGFGGGGQFRTSPPAVPPAADQGLPQSNEGLSESVQEDLAGKNYGRIQGIVYNEQGKPAQGVEVRIHRLDAKGDFRTKTGSDGRYSYTGLAPGDYAMGVLYDGDVGLIRMISVRAGHIFVSDFGLAEFVAMMKPDAFDKLK